MKYVKILGLAAVAAMALMAFASSASATVLKHEGTNMKAGEELEATVTTSALLQTTGGATIATCTGGVVGGSITNAGGAGQSVTGSISSLSWSGCNTTVDTLNNGTLSLTYTSGNNGTVSSTGAEVTINFLGVSCIFKTTNTTVGTFTGGSPATFDINGNIPGTSAFPCPTSGVWSGNYTVTNPTGTLDAAES